MTAKAENPDLDPAFTPTEEIEKDHRGTPMTEIESWERVIEGMKLASDGCRQMARRGNASDWNKMAEMMDAVRRAVIRDGGFDRPADAKPSEMVTGGPGISPSEAVSRIAKGLKMASAGARQISLGQRMDIRWTGYANAFDRLMNKAYALSLRTSGLVVDAAWSRNGHPARAH